MGDSRGHWDGDTLVVETTNFLRETSFRGGITTPDLRLIERFTRASDDTLMYEVTIEDPNAWAQPWTYVIPMTRNDQPLFEYACHEGNYGLYNILAGRANAGESREGLMPQTGSGAVSRYRDGSSSRSRWRSIFVSGKKSVWVRRSNRRPARAAHQHRRVGMMHEPQGVPQLVRDHVARESCARHPGASLDRNRHEIPIGSVQRPRKRHCRLLGEEHHHVTTKEIQLDRLGWP